MSASFISSVAQGWHASHNLPFLETAFPQPPGHQLGISFFFSFVVVKALTRCFGASTTSQQNFNFRKRGVRNRCVPHSSSSRKEKGKRDCSYPQTKCFTSRGFHPPLASQLWPNFVRSDVCIYALFFLIFKTPTNPKRISGCVLWRVTLWAVGRRKPGGGRLQFSSSAGLVHRSVSSVQKFSGD